MHSPRHRTEIAQLRALLDTWKIRGCDDAWQLIKHAEEMVSEEMAWYERLGIPERYDIRTRRPWRVKLAMWLLHHNDKRRQWLPRLKAVLFR
jgi:hypothetical protein